MIKQGQSSAGAKRMYASLSLKRLSSSLALSLAVVFGLFIAFRGVPADASEWIKTFSLAMRCWLILLLLIFGWSGKLAPWRMIWWCVPPLNRLVFPDLNGKWTGTIKSNWSVIEALLQAATTKGSKIDRDDLPAIPLKDVGIEMQITASLFTFRVEAILHGVDGKSYSLTERIQKNDKRDRFELFYLYRQTTPEPAATDEDSHDGSARLDVDTKAWSLDGQYWNRRSWRSGLNAAGLLSVKRVNRGNLF